MKIFKQLQDRVARNINNHAQLPSLRGTCHPIVSASLNLFTPTINTFFLLHIDADTCLVYEDGNSAHDLMRLYCKDLMLKINS